MFGLLEPDVAAGVPDQRSESVTAMSLVEDVKKYAGGSPGGDDHRVRTSSI
ncbi:MAG: hypothetical protein IT537_23755 [Hyphomicrobiales bacterium]|nr:hypothetical protein [Hyphomicrobiales bacterium]